MPHKGKYYMISVVSQMFNLHPQTLRIYEREGLVRPSRTVGNTRLYSEEDLLRIEMITHLTRELGVNLAGVEVILNMRERMEDMHRQMEEMVKVMRSRMEDEIKDMEERWSRSLVPVGKRGMVFRKK